MYVVSGGLLVLRCALFVCEVVGGSLGSLNDILGVGMRFWRVCGRMSFGGRLCVCLRLYFCV